jgi:hypothetical protein
MSLPDQVRLRITSEGAESIAISPVVVQEMPLYELVRQILGVTGKNAERVREILARGSLVAGASRFRWDGFAAEHAEVTSFLGRYPDPDRSLPFDSGRCFLAVLHGRDRQFTIERAAGERKRFLRRRSFWVELLTMAAAPAYFDFSYRESADIYRWSPASADLDSLRSASKLLAYSTLETQIRTAAITCVDLYVRRSA